MSEANVVILGGGPAGVGGAYQLRRRQTAHVTLIEQQERVGGNAGSFEMAGQRLDFGSHRLHARCDPAILQDIRNFLGDDLLDRPRHGRIRLRGRWLHFPLKPLDMMLRLDPAFALGTARDMVRRVLPHRNGNGSDTFASVLLASLGPTICRDFYFPYARKVWGKEPEQLSGTSARRRVSAGNFRKLARRIIKPPGAGRFYYPRKGFGQISEAYADAARAAGADLMLGWKVTGLERASGRDGWSVRAERHGEQREIAADHVWSTLPIPIVARMMRPAVDEALMRAAAQIEFRAMLVVYLHLDTDQFSDIDAHYFPEENVSITRLSEPKNYAALTEPRGRTTLCAELPCTVTDEVWKLSDEELGQHVVEDMARAGLRLARPPVGVTVKRLSHAYPIYTQGYEQPFGQLDAWAESLPNFLVYGRQGLFAHDNTHHALYMAYAAVDCLDGKKFDQEKWNEYRKVFATHVVED